LRVSIILPVLDEAPGVRAALQSLQALRARGCEVLVVDGGSVDGTPVLARPLADRVLDAQRGRALQMNAGAAAASGDALVFLHADTHLPERADDLVRAALAHRAWGRFDVGIDSADPALRVVGAMMNLRSRLTGIATGDQAIFATAGAFRALGGFPPIPLMEDVAFSQRARRVSPPACVRERVRTSPRRWEKHGVLRTVLLMWRLRLEYALGADPAELARRYLPHSTPGG
jgi:rSAM/selenodomain-associated transferase 2